MNYCPWFNCINLKDCLKSESIPELGENLCEDVDCGGYDCSNCIFVSGDTCPAEENDIW